MKCAISAYSSQYVFTVPCLSCVGKIVRGLCTMLPRGRGLCCMFVISNSLFFPFSCKDLNKLDSAHPPRAPCGARQRRLRMADENKQFQSTRPVRGATLTRAGLRPHRWQFQSTRPVRGATVKMHMPRKCFAVSIHAPRAGRDWRRLGRLSTSRCFNPRAPCGARPNVYGRKSH